MSAAPVAKVFGPTATPKRWRVEATYRTEGEPLVLVHEVEELEEVQDWVEVGPDWRALIAVTITYQRAGDPGQCLTAATARAFLSDLSRPEGPVQ